jgi:hypothetical protein
VAGLMVFASAVALAAKSVEMFGSFLVNDVIKPGLALNKTGAQVGNLMGVSGAEVSGAVRGFEAQ